MFSDIEKFNVKNDNYFHPVTMRGTKAKDNNIMISLSKSDIFRFEQFHTNATSKYANVSHPNQYTKKVLFSKSGYFSPCFRCRYFDHRSILVLFIISARNSGTQMGILPRNAGRSRCMAGPRGACAHVGDSGGGSTRQNCCSSAKCSMKYQFVSVGLHQEKC